MWWKLLNGNYINSANVLSLYPGGAGVTWYIIAVSADGTLNDTLNTAPFSSVADAQDFIAKLTQGFDPAVIQ